MLKYLLVQFRLWTRVSLNLMLITHFSTQTCEVLGIDSYSSIWFLTECLFHSLQNFFATLWHIIKTITADGWHYHQMSCNLWHFDLCKIHNKTRLKQKKLYSSLTLHLFNNFAQTILYRSIKMCTNYNHFVHNNSRIILFVCTKTWDSNNKLVAIKQNKVISIFNTIHTMQINFVSLYAYLQ